MVKTASVENFKLVPKIENVSQDISAFAAVSWKSNPNITETAKWPSHRSVTSFDKGKMGDKTVL